MSFLPNFRPKKSLPSSLILLLSLGVISSNSSAEEPSFGYRFQKFHSGATDPESNGFGNAVALSDRFILVGESANDDLTSFAGAAWVFDVRTGRRLRKLTPPEEDGAGLFGTSVAACGYLGLIGATTADGAASDSGAAYLYDLRNGRLIRKLAAPTGTAANDFGTEVAMSADYHVVSDRKDSSGRGKVFVFDARNGDLLSELTASDGDTDDFLGFSLALDGPILAVGAVRADGASSNCGAVYLFNLSKPESTMTEIEKITASNGLGGDNFGFSVALDGNHLLAGAPGRSSGAADSGAAYLVNYIFGAENAIIVPSDPTINLELGNSVAMEGEVCFLGTGPIPVGRSSVYRFDGIERNNSLGTVNESGQTEVPSEAAGIGRELALSDNRLLISSSDDSDLGSGAGAAFLLEDVVGPIPLQSEAQRGGFVPGAVETQYRSFLPPVISWRDSIGFCSNFVGEGTRGGRRKGVCANTATEPVVELFAQTGEDPGPGFMLRRIDDLIYNNSFYPLIQGRVSGGGTNATNNRFVWSLQAPNSFVEIVRTGPTGLLGGGGESFLVFPQVGQASDNYIGVSYRLRPVPGGVNRSNDSGVAILDHSGNPLDISAREGGLIPGSGSDRYLQFFHRNAIQGFLGYYAFGCFVVGSAPDSTPVRVVVADSAAGNPDGVAIEGFAAPDMGAGVNFRTFLGESMDGDSKAVAYRGVVTGTGVNRSNNEGIFHEFDLVARKGEEPDPTGEPGVRIARFLKVWQSYGEGVIFLGKLRGPGVNASNDCALFGWTSTDGTSYRCLFREGDAVAGSDCARVGVIQRVDVEPTAGRVIILCSLAGGNRSANQALFVGRVGNPNANLRTPWMILRKGIDFRSPAFVNTSIRSMMIRNSDDRTGFGAKGQGKSIEDQIKLGLVVTYDNRAVEIATGDF